ncbi:MAG: hypothetical protein IJP56_08190 [Synergistaceae bacterium]|nr:hypothetical protein [Synergistaceae bacterium]
MGSLININNLLISSALKLRDELNNLKFITEFDVVYNVLDYALEPYKIYCERFGANKKRALFLGMNPGPWGMAQTGVPFGEVNIVRDWLKINAKIYKPEHEHDKYKVTGFDCKRSEVSGKRLWGLFKEIFIEPEKFFENYFVINYCPLLFIKDGRNFTPDKLKASERGELYKLCDEYLRECVKIFEPEFLVGIGNFAYERAREALINYDSLPDYKLEQNYFKIDSEDFKFEQKDFYLEIDLEPEQKIVVPEFERVKIIKILHPSPASPMSNKNWPEVALNALQEAKVF